jgi:hypothetical protein
MREASTTQGTRDFIVAHVTRDRRTKRPYGGWVRSVVYSRLHRTDLNSQLALAYASGQKSADALARMAIWMLALTYVDHPVGFT